MLDKEINSKFSMYCKTNFKLEHLVKYGRYSSNNGEQSRFDILISNYPA